MAGYWPSSSFACLWTETESRSINAQKKRTRAISSHLASRPNKLGQLRIHYMAFGEIFLAGHGR